MDINFLTTGFIIPSIMSIAMLMIPVAIFSKGSLTLVEIMIYAVLIYILIILIAM